MTLGGGFTATMPSPVHAGGDQGDSGRVDQVNGSFEFTCKALPGFATDKTRREIAQMLEHFPKEFLGHLRGSNLVGVGKIVAAGRGGTSQAGERTRIQSERVTDIVKSDAMR